MSYETLEQLNATGIVGIFQTNANAVQPNMFPAMIIFAIWAIITIGSFFSNIRRYGKGKLWASVNVGGFVASIVAGLFMIIPNFMPMRILVITVVLEIIAFVVLMTDENLKDE